MSKESIAELIRKLRRDYVGGETDLDLCTQGSVIYDRLEVDYALAGTDARRRRVVDAERRAFEQIIRQIRNGRHTKALDDYDQYVFKKEREKSRKK